MGGSVPLTDALCQYVGVEYLTVDITVREWQLVDGAVDNSMAVDAVDGVAKTLMVGACVRDAGWRASATYAGDRDEYGWPPLEHLLPLTLRRAHWTWVLAQLDRWAPHARVELQATSIISAALADPE